MKWPVERTIIAGFGLALVILIAIGVVSYQSTLNVESAAALRAHSDQVRSGIQTLLSQLLDTETGERGFIITGDEAYLEPYTTAAGAVRNQAASLRTLTGNSPVQQQSLNTLDPLIAARLSELQQTIDARRSQGLQAAEALVLTNRGKQTMDQIRRVLGDMLAEEDRPNTARDAPLSRDLLTVRAVLAGGGALAGLTIILALAVIRRELNSRQRVEKALAAQAQVLASERDLLQVLMDNIPDTIYFKDRESRFTRINRAQAKVLGVAEPAAANGKTDMDFQREEVARRSFAGEQEIIAGGQPLIDWIEYVPMPDGAPRWFSSTKIPIRDGAGQVTGLVGISRDVTEHQQTQAALEAMVRERTLSLRMLSERTQALEAANRELEAFSYSVSHDLRAPLRALDGFSQILLEEYADQVGAQGRNYLQRVRAASQKMGELIDAMLSLARVTRSEMRHEPVDLTAQGQAVMAALHAGEPERQVEAVIAPGLSVEGDPRLLRDVLENLLGNAWKFTGKTPNPRIELGSFSLAPGGASSPGGPSAAEAEELVFFVRDNGAGFDMAHTDRLFGAFQRLHGQAEFSGSGIGLATVQRILHRHGGRVWAEGQVDRGATFYFTLPTQTLRIGT